MYRRQFICTAAGAVAMTIGSRTAFAASPIEKMTVYKDPNCGCCRSWADAMARAGFDVEVIMERDLISVKKRLGVPLEVQGCHTATVAGYFLEGHVPIESAKRLLAQKPADIAGLVVPGMPSGSLGMGDDPSASYDVLVVERAGKTSVYLEVRPKA